MSNLPLIVALCGFAGLLALAAVASVRAASE
jgi:hypothetical protein